MTAPTDEMRRVTVIGAGTMGHGIAQVASMAGYLTVLHDTDPSQADVAIDRVRANLANGVERGKVSVEDRERAISNLSTSTDLQEAAGDADLVIEAIPERMQLKRSLFSRLDAIAPPGAMLATNTSSLSITDIARATERPDRVVGLHFFNPVHIMRLLEVVRGEQTSRETLNASLGFARAIGKEPIVVTDTPGFASSRLGVVLGLEAMRMVEEGVATPTDIDRAMELGYNHPMGPLRLTDLVGLDVRLGIAEYLYDTLGGEQYHPPQILRRYVAEGRLGRKSGRGFHDWA